MAAYVPPHRRNKKYESAYEAQRDREGKAVSAVDATDPKTQYAKLVEFSRYRRERLGQRQHGERKRQSAPRAFGTNDHGRGLEAHQDIDGGSRVDDEGMVYETADGAVYFCDRFRRYRFWCGRAGLSLLRGLVAANKKLLAANADLFSKDPEEAAAQRAEGYALYEEKPNLRRKGIGTWSNEEYGLPGFQWMYCRLKSFQRFAETWALLERCAAGGLFDDVLASSDDNPLRVCSLGGGPGYELLAFEWFAEYWASSRDASTDWTTVRRRPGLTLASLDLQPSWETYVSLLGYEFQHWDVHDSDSAPITGQATRVVCLLSNILCYCTDDATADFFCHLLESGKVAAILANERGAEQRMCGLLERRGVTVVRFLDQSSAGRDDRQLAFLPPSTPASLPNIPLADDALRVFPNQPYEERKNALRSSSVASSAPHRK